MKGKKLPAARSEDGRILSDQEEEEEEEEEEPEATEQRRRVSGTLGLGACSPGPAAPAGLLCEFDYLLLIDPWCEFGEGRTLRGRRNYGSSCPWVTVFPPTS